MSQVAAIITDRPAATPAAAAPAKMGNPAVVGLAAFGLTTMLLQFHNLGWMGMGPVLWTGVFFGGIAQICAGLQEHKNGNNFGYTVFTSFGCFWLGFAGMVVASKYGLFPVSKTDVGFYLVAWTLYSGIMLIGSLRISKAMLLAFVSLEVGLVALDIEHFGGSEQLTVFAACMMLITVGTVWYMMAHIVFHDLFGRDVLPVGKPVL
jgi:succinate-acetate transporter protein